MPLDQLSITFAALADPTRRAILSRLASGEASVKELAEPFAMSLPAVTKHLKVLQRAGLITQGRQAQWRPCRLEAQPLHEVADWVEQYRRFWEARLDRLDAYLQELQTAEKKMHGNNNIAASAAGCEIVISRVFAAPRELVWKAWTDPERVKQWWGPKGFNSPCCAMDFRVGGCFHLDMCAPDGAVYPCRGIYREIVAPERIVFAGEADDGHPCGAGLPPRSLVTVTFAECQGKTTLTIHTRFESAARRAAAVEAGFGTSWAACLERLAEFVT